MNALLATLHSVAETWWSYLAHATWQSAAVGLVIFAAVYLMRRWPAPLRYGLLMVAVLKFAVPPLVAIPYGPLEPERDHGRQSLAVPHLMQTAPLTNVSMLGAEAKDAPLPAGSALPLQLSSSILPHHVESSPAPPDGSSLQMDPRVVGSLRDEWKVLLFVVHVLGGVLAGAYVLWGFLRTWRFAARCEGVEDGELRRCFDRLRQRLGLRRRVRLLLASEECAPMALGVMRPSVVLPRRLVQTMGPARLEAVLAHELAHHRRKDMWVLSIENLLLALWWFHPVFWLVRRGLRNAREDCCDDMLLDARVADRETYCEILLQAAAQVAQPGWARAALGVSERFHPLGRRFKRIMDTSLQLAPRLSLAGALIVIVLAILLLPGVRLMEGKADAQAALQEAVAKAPEKGLVAYYPLNGDAQDHSGNGNHGVVNGATPTTDRTGAENAALHFDGNDDFVEIPNSDTLNVHGETSLSIGAWVKTASNPLTFGYGKAIVWKWGPGMEEDDQFVLALAEGGAFFGLSDRPSRVSTGSLPVGQWVSLVGVYDADEKAIRLYVNGELESTKRLAASIRNTTTPLHIGKGEIARQQFSGDIDDVRIYSRALTPDEIQSPYKGPSYEERMKAVAAQPASDGTRPSADTSAETEKEIQEHYAKADPDVQEYIGWTARNFARGGLWRAANAYENLSPEEREKRILYTVDVLKGDYGRHLCTALADAGALKDKRLLPGLIKVAAFHREDSDYDCRPKWMAVAALGRQDDESAVPTLIPLVDHGNQNTRMWARASLVRLTGQNFGGDKQAWGKWWNDSGKKPLIDLKQLKPWTPPPRPQTESTPQIQPSSSVPAGGTGPKKGVLRFDGVDDLIHIPTATQLNLTSNVTISAWVKPDPDCGESPVLYRGDAQPGRDPYVLGVDKGKMRFIVMLGQGQGRNVSPMVTANLKGGWHYWTGVRDGAAGKIYLYKDGQLVSEAPAAAQIEYETSAMYNEIGAVDSGAWGGTWGFFKGEIDQISVWNVARKPDEIKHDFAEGLKGNEPGLVALWTFDEDGQTINDASSFKCSATLGRTPEPDPSDPTRVTTDAAPAKTGTGHE